MSMVDDSALFGFDQRHIRPPQAKRAKRGDTVIGLARQTRRDRDRSVSPEIDLQNNSPPTNSDSEMDSDRNSSDRDGESEIDSDRSECELEGETYKRKRYFSETTKRPRTSAHTTPTRNVSSSIEELKECLFEVKGVMKNLCKKVEKNERTLKELQDAYSTGPSSSESGSSPESAKKCAVKDVPPAVRRELRRVYKLLLDEDENFNGWIIETGKNFNSSENTAVVTKLIKEIKGLNPTFDAGQIRDAAYRFYRTKCEESSSERRGVTIQRKTTKRRHERTVRKRKERETAVMKNKKLNDDQKVKWLKVMKNEYMSSEESGPEDTIIVHPLPWRTAYVNKMFEKIDAYVGAKKSSQAKRQMKKRVVGDLSTRPVPTGKDIPSFAVKTTEE